ncbi:MAG TPA: AAA family ATPase [Caldimonas sp.]|jgi:DNA-binding SARP family transcriptional activator|nr:AAA family ATPase [Caldimonas sp.]
MAALSARTEPAKAAALQLRGEPRCIVAAGAAVPLETSDALLLAYLCLEGPTSRARMATLLWPDADEARARGNLRQRLLRLRKSIGADLLTGRAQLAIGAHVTHDTEGDTELLASIAVESAGGLGEWLEGARSLRRHARLEALAGEASRLESGQRIAEALVIAHQLVGADPASEHAHRRVMRLHYLRGDRAAALTAFADCAAALARELGAEPSAETLQLKTQIERSTALALQGAQTPLWLLRPPRLVGRAAAIAELAAAVGAQTHALVLGDAGMGKSRLLEAFVQQHAAVAVQARPGDEHSPFIVLARLLRALFAAGVQPAPEACAELARIVPECGRAATAKFDRASFESAVEDTLVRAGTSLVVVAVDDLHFADIASVELLARIGTAALTPRLVLAARAREAEAALAVLSAAFGDGHRLAQIDLAPLPREAIEELLVSLELPRVAPVPLAAAVARHTGGNPQFILETLKALLADGSAGPGQDGQLPLPRSVGLLIERRLRQLSAPAIRLARVAAVAGSDFSPGLAAAVLACGPLDLADPWSELEAAAVLRDHRFAHDLVYETVLAGVPRAIAREMHGAVAQLLQREGAGAARIAEHWLDAGATDKALPLLLASAHEAKEAMCYHEAAQCFDKAIAILARGEDAVAESAALLALFDCLLDLDRQARVDLVLARLDALAVTAAMQARALEARARALLVRLELDAALAAGAAALELALAAKEVNAVFDARLVMTQILAKLDRLEEAEALLVAARAFAESEASTQQRVYFFEAAAFLVTQNERFEEGRALWQKLEASAGEMKSPRTVATALNYQTLCEGNVGAFAQAAATAERWRDYVVDHGLLGEARQFLDLNLAYVYQNLGRYADALAAIERAEALNVAHLGGLHVRYASAYTVLGQFARVRRHLDVIGEQTPMTPGLRLTAMILRLRLFRVAGTRAPPGQGVDEVLRQAEQVAVASQKVAPRVRWLLARAEFLDADAAVEAAREAGALALAKGLHGSRIGAEVLLARALMRQGEAKAALPRVRIALGLAASYQPDVVYFAEIGQAAHEVLTANGENGAAILRDTVDWIQRVTAHQVPAEFRDSFMHRNPVNRDLLAAASRLGRGDALLR